MKYKVKIDPWLRFLFFGLFFYMLGIAVLTMLENNIIVSVITIALAVFIISIILKAEMEFKDEYLFVQIGFIYSKIYYEKITDIQLTKKIITSGFALSREIIRIQTKSFLKTIDISPTDRQEVYDELKRRSGV